jgi:hypothetical protein
VPTDTSATFGGVRLGLLSCSSDLWCPRRLAFAGLRPQPELAGGRQDEGLGDQSLQAVCVWPNVRGEARAEACTVRLD